MNGMRKGSIILFVLVLFATCQAQAVAPVVDDSDHFTMFNDDGVKPPPAMHEQRGGLHEQQGQQYAQNNEPIAKAMPEEATDDSLSAQVQTLQQEMQRLRGELEVQAHTIEQLKQHFTQSSLEVPVKTHATPKVTQQQTPPLASTPVPSLPNPSVPVATLVNPANEQVAYLAAYDLVKTKRYPEALVALDAFVKQYPSGGYTANAEYWMGELYLVLTQPANAIKHFEIVLQRFPHSSKAAASALKMGYAYSALGNNEEAKHRFQEVIKNYPDTSAAQLAKGKLAALLV